MCWDFNNLEFISTSVPFSSPAVKPSVIECDETICALNRCKQMLAHTARTRRLLNRTRTRTEPKVAITSRHPRPVYMILFIINLLIAARCISITVFVYYRGWKNFSTTSDYSGDTVCAIYRSTNEGKRRIKAH